MRLHGVAIAYFGNMESDSQINMVNMMLRLLLISEMLKRKDRIMHTFVTENLDDPEVLNSAVNLLESALFSFSWGDELSLFLLALALDRRIVVYRNNFAPNNRDGYFVGTQENRTPITLFHYGNHYMYMYIPAEHRWRLIYPSTTHRNDSWL